MTTKQLIFSIPIILILGIVIANFGKLEWLIWGIFLLCPLMHLFGHNHSGHNHSKNNGSSGHHH